MKCLMKKSLYPKTKMYSFNKAKAEHFLKMLSCVNSCLILRVIYILSSFSIDVLAECQSFSDHRNYHLLPQYPDCGRGFLQPGVRVESRILGGNKAVLGEFPWTVRLMTYLSVLRWTCGGSLINERYVVSAGHCVIGQMTDPTRRVAVDLGELNRETDPDCEGSRCAPPSVKRSVTHLFLDPHYRELKGVSYKDIALLRLKDGVSYSEYLRPICLPFNCLIRSATFVGVDMTIAGWGRSSQQGYAKTLMKLKSPVADWEACVNILRPYGIKMNPAVQQCFNVSKTESSCGGDSGGPVMLETRVSTKCRCAAKGKEYPLGPTHYVNVLMAVMNSGPSCFGPSRLELPNLHTKVVPYLKFILNKIKE